MIPLRAGLDTFTFLGLHYFGVKKLEYFFASLIAVMLACFYVDLALSQAIPTLGLENNTQTSNYLPAWGAISTSFTSGSNAASWFAMPSAINSANMTLSDSGAQRVHFPIMRNHG